jgi:hypothetical protein
MNELEKELDQIMTEAMTEIDSERLSHQKKVIDMLEQKMFEADGLPDLAELYGIVEVTEGEDKINEFMKNMPEKDQLIDATIGENNPCGIAGLMRVVHCGNGTDIYEPLQDLPTQVGMNEFCHGLLIRVPITGVARDNPDEKHTGSVTCLALENVISIVVRMVKNNGSVCQTEVFDVTTYTLGKPERKLIDAMYFAYFMPRYLKEHSALFYASILSFNEWRNNRESE